MCLATRRPRQVPTERYCRSGTGLYARRASRWQPDVVVYWRLRCVHLVGRRMARRVGEHYGGEAVVWCGEFPLGARQHMVPRMATEFQAQSLIRGTGTNVRESAARPAAAQQIGISANRTAASLGDLRDAHRSWLQGERWS